MTTLPRRSDTAQTLSRGLTILEMLASAPAALSTSDIARRLDVPRTNVNRLLNTLLQHDLISGSSKAWRVGAGIHALSNTKTQAAPQTPMILQRVSERLEMTAFLVHERNSMCVTLACAEIPRQGATLTQRPGTVHSLRRGAPGIALLVSIGDQVSGSTLQELAGDRLAEVKEARTRGWAFSQDEVIPGLKSIAVPIRSSHVEPTALAVVTLLKPDIDEVVRILTEEAHQL